MTSLELGREDFFKSYPVSHETKRKLERYAELLVDWNQRVNLVSASTLPALWQRHMADSAQLFDLLPTGTQSLVDLGSGAGFPGLVLALMGVPEVHLVESIGKKARFLQAVADELAPNVTVHSERAEKIKNMGADVITARAVTALPELLSMAKPFMKADSLGVFLKGEKAEAELTAARKYWTFMVEKTPSRTDPSGMVLSISRLKILHSHDTRCTRSHS